MVKEDFAKKLVEIFPEKSSALAEHYGDFGELLGHVFFADEIGDPLFELLKEHVEFEKIDAYCRFVEEMWRCGTEDVVNIVNVTILERLSDDTSAWNNFSMHITQAFQDFINDEILTHNPMMQHVQRLH